MTKPPFDPSVTLITPVSSHSPMPQAEKDAFINKPVPEFSLPDEDKKNICLELF